VGSGTDLHAMEKRKILPLPEFEPRPTSRSPPLHRQNYPESQKEKLSDELDFGVYRSTKPVIPISHKAQT
jgi:hypothetical protein